MLNTRIKGPWIIGGSGRSGKTTLVNLIENSENEIAGFPLELLINVYDKQYIANFKKNKRHLANEYICRTRYLDVERKIKKSLLDLINSENSKKKFLQLPNNILNSIQLIDWIMSVYANEMNCESWAAFDLHPEFKFEKYSKFISNLNMLIMIRDPREVIAEIMFWRGKPKNHIRKFYHSLISWSLSIKTTFRLMKKYPENVDVIFFNNLVNKDKNEYKKLRTYFNISDDDIEKTFKNIYYSYNDNEGHLLPSGNSKKLLSDDELSIIETICMPLLNQIEKNYINQRTSSANKTDRLFIEKLILFFINQNNHNSIRNLNEFIFFPKKFIKRIYTNLKKILRQIIYSSKI